MVEVLWEYMRQTMTWVKGYKHTNRRVLKGARLGDDLMNTSRRFCNFQATHNYSGVPWRLGFSLHTKLLGKHRSRIVDGLNSNCITAASAFRYNKHVFTTPPTQWLPIQDKRRPDPDPARGIISHNS